MNLGTLAGVYRTPAMHAEVTAVFTNTNPMRPYRGNGRPESAYVIERMVDEAAAELGIDPIELRRRNMIPPEAMPFKTGLIFTYDCGEFAKNLDLALELADFAGFEQRRAEVARAAASCAASASPNTIERAAAGGFEAAEIRFDRGGTATLLSGSITQGMGHETIYKQLVCDRLGIHPDRVHYIQGDTDKVAIGEGSGGSRSATLGGSAVHLATEKIVAKAKAIAAHLLEAAEADIDFADGVFAIAGTDRARDARRYRRGWRGTRRACPTAWSPASSPSAAYQPPSSRISRTASISANWRSTRIPARSRSCSYSVVDDVGTVMNPLLLEGQIRGGIAQGVGQIADGGHPFRRRLGAARHRLVHGLRDAARRRPLDVRIARPTRCRPRPTRSASRARAKPALSARCRRSATRWSTR